MADQDPPARGLAVNPTLLTGPFVLPLAEADVEAEGRIAAQLAAMAQAAAGPRARLTRSIAFTWRWYANLCGAAVISGALSALVVWAVAPDEAAVRALSAAQPEIAAACPDQAVPCVRPGGRLAFVQDMQRLASCPGDVVEIFTRPPRVDRSKPTAVELIQQRRPAQNITVALYPKVRQETVVPTTLAPGRWGFSWSVDSRCPGRETVDQIASFEIEVLP